MVVEILLYSSVYSWTVSDIITQLEAQRNNDIRIRINSPGGEVMSGYGIIAKMREHKKNMAISVDGLAASFSAIMCCSVDDVECLDVTNFMFHRAAYPEYIELSQDRFTDDLKASLVKMNDELKSIMASKIDEKKFKKITGKSFDDIFSLDDRIDVWLTAEQAKEVGLVKKINSITAEKRSEIEALAMGLAAMGVPNLPKPENNSPNPQTSKKMTIEILKKEHPEVYAVAFKDGETSERDRVCEHLVFMDIDAELCAKNIKEGKILTRAEMTEMNRKSWAKDSVAGLEKISPADVATGEVSPKGEPTAEAKAIADFEAAVNLTLGIK